MRVRALSAATRAQIEWAVVRSHLKERLMSERGDVVTNIIMMVGLAAAAVGVLVIVRRFLGNQAGGLEELEVPTGTSLPGG